MSEMIKSIAVVGSGLPLVMATALVGKSLKPFNTKIVAIDTGDAYPIVGGEHCGPEFSALCEILQLSEKDIISRCMGTFRLGTLYRMSQPPEWFVPYAHMGITAEQDDFEQGLFQYIGSQADATLNNWSVASQAALTGKFAIAGAKRADLRKALEYGVHLDKKAYLTLIKAASNQHDVIWQDIDIKKENVILDESENIHAVTDGKQHIEADFWIDISHDGKLSQVFDQQRFVSPIPVTHRMEWQDDEVELALPCSVLQKLHGGWLKTVSLRDKTHYQLFACADVMSLEQQLHTLNIDIPDSAQWQPVRCGWMNRPWQGNCLAIGDNAVQLSGLLYSELQLVQAALVQFLDLFPDWPIGECNRRQYNQVWGRFIADASDFTEAHFVAQFCDNMSPSLTRRIAMFNRLGRLETAQSDAVTDSQWYHLLFGLGYRPQLPSVVLSKFDRTQITDKLEKVRGAITNLTTGMPDHKQYLQRFYPLTSK